MKSLDMGLDKDHQTALDQGETRHKFVANYFAGEWH